MFQEVPEKLIKVETGADDNTLRPNHHNSKHKTASRRKSEFETLDYLRNQLTYYSSKKVLIERTFDELQDTFTDIGDSVLQVNKLQSAQNSAATVLDEIIEEAKSSVTRLQSEIDEYKLQLKSKERVESLSPVKMPHKLASSSPRSNSSTSVVRRPDKDSKLEALEQELNRCQQRNKMVLIEEWESREQYNSHLKNIETLKRAVSESDEIQSDSLFGNLFQEWLQLRGAESFLKAQKSLLDQEIKSLERNNAVNLVEAQKSSDLAAEIANLELLAETNQQKLQRLFKEVYQSNEAIEKLQEENLDLISHNLLPSLEVSENLAKLPLQISSDLASLKNPNADEKAVNSFCNSLTSSHRDRVNFEFRAEVKKTVGVASGLRDCDAIAELESQLDTLRSNQSIVNVNNVKSEFNFVERLPELSESCVKGEVDLGNRMKLLERRKDSGVNDGILSQIEQSLLEMEDECGQYVVPWVTVDGLSLRQYRQLVKDKFSNSKSASH